MKKILLFVSALAGLFLAGSCQREELAPVEEAGVVTFEVNVPGVATKAIGDDVSNINKLVYDVYWTEQSVAKAEDISVDNLHLLYKGTRDVVEGKSTVPVELLKDKNYVILFWAQRDNTWGFASEDRLLKNGVTFPDEFRANAEDIEAFYGVSFLNKIELTGSKNVTLYRPFAQLNVGTKLPNDKENPNYTVSLKESKVVVKNAGAKFNLIKQEAEGNKEQITFTSATVPSGVLEANDDSYHYAAMNYIFAAGNVSVQIDITTNDHGTIQLEEMPAVPVAKNYRTNIIGSLLTSNAEYSVQIDQNWKGEYDRPADSDSHTTNTFVTNADEFKTAFESEEENLTITLTENINLNDLLATRSETTVDPTYVLANGKSLVIDLNGKKLFATSLQTGKNYNMFDVRGTLTVKNGTIEYEHLGENMGWGSSTNIFNVTAGGVLNLEGVTAKNLGGSDMGFVAHLNNWGEVTLNAENCTLESNYVPVRVFNSGYDMNNVTIKNSTLKGNSAAFWVHNYTVEDFGSAEKAEAQKALLNLSIYDQGNTFLPDVNGVRYGFTNSVRSDAYGITKTVSEDGTEVTLGTLVENGLVRRGVAGAEENTTITKAIVGEGITTLYDRTFRRFYALETVELPEGLTTIGAAGTGVFQTCTALKNITIPESVTVLGLGTFQGCSSLESINIPAGVTRIEEKVFNATGLVSVEFHEGVTYFGKMAFRDCKQLKEVYINAPEFTIEPDAFVVMAGALPGTTIYVVNDAMKTYLESTLSYKSQFTIVGPSNDTESLKEALATDAKIVNVAAGTYTFPASSVKPGTTIVCAEGTVFTGTSSLDINGATVVGATFKNEGGQAVSGTINGTFKNCTFEGEEALRWCYTSAGTTSVFENCVIKTDWRGFHFDTMNGDVVFKNCEINGFNAFGGEATITFEGCTFGNDQSKYNGLNIYANTVLTNCQFNYISGKTNFVDMEGTGKTLSINNCTATLDGVAKFVTDFVGGSKIDQNTVILDGKVYVSNAAQFTAAVDNGATDIVWAGEFRMPSNGTSNAITISALNDNAVIDNTWGAYWESATLTFNGINIKTSTGMANGTGSDYAALYSKNVTYNNCNFSGPMRLGRDGAKFNACTFNNLGNDYVWTYGKAATFNGCTFNTEGKALLIYSDGAEGNGAAPAVSVTNCTFNATQGAKAAAIANQNCAAVEIHNYGNGVTLTTSGNTVDSDFSGVWRIKTYETNYSESKIIVNGTEYKTIAVDGKTMTIDASKNVTVNN